MHFRRGCPIHWLDRRQINQLDWCRHCHKFCLPPHSAPTEESATDTLLRLQRRGSFRGNFCYSLWCLPTPQSGSSTAEIPRTWPMTQWGYTVVSSSNLDSLKVLWGSQFEMCGCIGSTGNIYLIPCKVAWDWGVGMWPVVTSLSLWMSWKKRKTWNSVLLCVKMATAYSTDVPVCVSQSYLTG